jgi:PAS domain S-box-containing protein
MLMNRGVDKKNDKNSEVFDHCAVSLWEEDLSGLQVLIKDWRSRGIRDLRAYLGSHHRIFNEAIRAIRVVDVNEAALQLYETEDKKKLLGPLEDILTAETIPTLMEFIIAITEGRKNFEGEAAAMSLKGRRLDLFVKVFIPGETDEYGDALMSMLDITGHKRLQRDLEEERTLLRAVVDSIPDQIFIKDKEKKFVLANQALAHWAGFANPDELVGKSDFDLFPSDIAQEYRKDDEAVLASGMARPNIEEQIGSRSGSLGWALTTKVPVRTQDGTVVGLVGIVRDVTERRRVEEALRESEEMYRTIFTEAPVGIFHSTPGGKLLTVNPTFARMMGYGTPEQIIEEVNKKNIAEVLFEDPRHRLAIVEALVRNPGWQRVESRYRRKNGSIMVAQLTARAFVPLGSEGSELEGFIEDITARRWAEQDLAWERSLFTALMENLPDYVYFKDRASRLTRVSRSHASALGLKDPSEAIGKTDADFFSEVHAQKALADEQQIIKTGNPMLDIEERETRKGQPDAWVITSKIPLSSPQGDIIGTFGISHDITERKKLEAKNQELAMLVGSANDAIVCTDLERRITVWNKGAERTFGYSAEEMIGTTISSLIPPECEEETRIVGEQVVQGEQTTHFETTRLCKDGARITVSMTFSAIRDPRGQIVGLASTARDVTAQKALEAQLSRVHRLESLAILSGGIAHQFNNINTITKGYLDLIRSQKSLPARSKSYADAALAGVQKAVNITDRLLMLTDPKPAVSTTVKLDVLARTMAALQKERMEEENVQLVLELSDTPPVAADESRLKFVLSSLIGNAIDSLLGRPVRTLTIRTGSTEDGVFFEVEDSGCGIPAADLPKLFMPFYSAKGEWAPPGSPQAKLKGVGLSLAVSNMSVSDHGGRIDVRSTEGVGSTFRVVLPTQGPGT